MDRRTLLKAAGSAAGLAVVGAAAGSAKAAERCRKDKSKICFKNEQFDDSDGKVDVEKGKDAILSLCEYHGYHVFPGLRESL